MKKKANKTRLKKRTKQHTKIKQVEIKLEEVEKRKTLDGKISSKRIEKNHIQDY